MVSCSGVIRMCSTAFSEDAAHFPDGRLLAVATPTNEAEIVRVLQTSSSVLAIGAQSSLTGGATPMGDVVLSTSRMNRILDVTGHRVRAQPGVTLTDLDTALRRTGHYYPPAPTFAGAFVGGIVATNAAGAATFKYGATRSWVEALTVVLASGDVLDVERGVTRAHPDGYFEIELADRRACVPVPRYRMPEVPKLAAGYFAAPGMDLIDLFVGIGRHARNHQRGHAARRAGATVAVPCLRAARHAPRRDRIRHATPQRGQGDVAIAGLERSGRIGHRAHGCKMPGASSRRRRRSSVRPRRAGRGDRAPGHARADVRHDRRGRLRSDWTLPRSRHGA